MEKYEKLIASKIHKNPCILLTAPTGTGKSTFIPQLIEKHFSNMKVAFIQPRRLAVLNIFHFLQNKMKISYKIRHAKKIKKDAQIIIMTDGIFIREIMAGKKYDFVIIDEIHERSIRTEFIMLYLKQSPVHKLLLMSATVTSTDIENFFNCKRIDLKINNFHAKVYYENENVPDYLVASYYRIKKILLNESKNKSKIKDVLVFLPGEEEILEMKKMLKRLGIDPFLVYSSITYVADQKNKNNNLQKLFQKREDNEFNVILATNIAETSITIPNIKYVIDTGVHRTKIFKNVNYIGLRQISKESADQRKGRCNRITDGICYRLYTQNVYDTMENMVPEIQRCDIADFLLWMLSLNMKLFHVDFLTYPFKENVKNALEFLIQINALKMIQNKSYTNDDFKNIINSKKIIEFEPQITNFGLEILKYPLDVKLANFLQISNNYSCGIPAAKIIALMNEENHNFLIKPQTYDLLSLHDLINMYLDEEVEGIVNQYTKKICENTFSEDLIDTKEKLFDKYKFCKENKINIKVLDRCILTFNQLKQKAYGNILENLEKAFSDSFQHNLSILQNDSSYLTEYGRIVFIHPSSYFFKKRVKKIVFADILCTTKAYVRIVGRFLP